MADSPFRSIAADEARKAGLDTEFVDRLITAESAWKPWATSEKGAVGLMQLMPETAKRFGVTDRRDPLQNIRGGIAYLKELSAKFPDRPDLVAASYNAGEGAVKKAGGDVPNYPETKAYV